VAVLINERSINGFFGYMQDGSSEKAEDEDEERRARCNCVSN
jgi:hypothetical protein